MGKKTELALAEKNAKSAATEAKVESKVPTPANVWTFLTMGVKAVSDWRATIGPLLVIFCLPIVLIYALPPESRLEFAMGLPGLVSSTGAAIAPVWIGFAGWVLLALTLVVGVPTFWKREREIVALGEENKLLRDRLDPQRLSSTNINALVEARKEIASDG